jgi:hypothetical protein
MPILGVLLVNKVVNVTNTIFSILVQGLTIGPFARRWLKEDAPRAE